MTGRFVDSFKKPIVFGPQDSLHFKCTSTVHQLEHRYWKHQLLIRIIQKHLLPPQILASKGYFTGYSKYLNWLEKKSPSPSPLSHSKSLNESTFTHSVGFTPRRLQRRERQARSINLKRRKNRGGKNVGCVAVTVFGKKTHPIFPDLIPKTMVRWGLVYRYILIRIFYPGFFTEVLMFANDVCVLIEWWDFVMFQYIQYYVDSRLESPFVEDIISWCF